MITWLAFNSIVDRGASTGALGGQVHDIVQVMIIVDDRQ